MNITTTKTRRRGHAYTPWIHSTAIVISGFAVALNAKALATTNVWASLGRATAWLIGLELASALVISFALAWFTTKD